MRQSDVRYAMASRDWGLRRIRNLTWGVAGAGAVSAAALAFGFGSHAHASQNGWSSGSRAPASSRAPSGNHSNGGDQRGTQLQPPPANPRPAQGRGQAVSGGS